MKARPPQKPVAPADELRDARLSEIDDLIMIIGFKRNANTPARRQALSEIEYLIAGLGSRWRSNKPANARRTSAERRAP